MGHLNRVMGSAPGGGPASAPGTPATFCGRTAGHGAAYIPPSSRGRSLHPQSPYHPIPTSHLHLLILLIYSNFRDLVMALNLLVAVPLALVAILLWKIVPVFVRIYTSPLRHLPGPPNPSWFWGQFKVIFNSDHGVPQEKWLAEYGQTITYQGMFGGRRLYTHDERAMNHILTHSNDFPKPEVTRYNLTAVLGAGVLVTEGEQHRQQRRIMNPAFGPAQIRELTGIFLEKAMKLRDHWQLTIDRNGGPTRIDVLFGLGRMTLDVIGLAGFNYEFDALADGKPNELNNAFKTIFQGDTQLPILNMLRMFVPPLRIIPTSRSLKTAAAMKVMRRIGMELIAEKKAAILSEKTQGADVEKKNVQGRDLLSLLIKANMSTDIPESQRLSDADVLAQVPTFIVAGHETTSTGVTWTLFALTQAPHVQTKLRNELLTVRTDMPSMDELNALPYLDMVVREVLRIHAPVASTIRVAAKNDEIPCAKPYTDRYGVQRDTIRIQKGDMVMIPIQAMNRDKTFWGEDSFEFKPERWENIPEAAHGLPGVWGHIMSFIGGPRACIGYRFSLIEMKALIFTLVRAFEYELAVDPKDVTKKSSIVQRPLILTEVEAGSQMPLIVKPYRAADSEDRV
ncbi:hypothetical protein EIP91_006313 [Steccherinum ochraceum]|uniref:Cytochrome P450-dit2 n=1 Tax=Steccherinum ochraceum TaxID=92696 RepID=A0A4V6N797_9APHY|nr:hypothetical protein EIP91_006313 [Steccherinum ochraceum]